MGDAFCKLPSRCLIQYLDSQAEKKERDEEREERNKGISHGCHRRLGLKVLSSALARLKYSAQKILRLLQCTSSMFAL